MAVKIDSESADDGGGNTIVVIGSNSFSGSDFIDHVLSTRPYRVIGISRSPEKPWLFLPYLRNPHSHRFQFVRLDLNHDMRSMKELLDAVQPAYVVNFASQSEVAPSWSAPEQWFQTNAVSTAALAKYLADADWLKRYVHISTPEVYGNCTGLVAEDHRFDPSTPYAASRAAAEMLLQTFIRSRGLPAVFVRSANVYGAHQQLFKICPRAAIFLKQGRTIELHGGGRQVRSFIHIRDVSRGELAILEHGRTGEAYHLATEQSVTIADLVAKICAIAGADFKAATRIADDRPGQDHAYLLDCRKAREQLGWRPEVRLDDGLRSVFAWVEQEWQSIRGEPLEYIHRP